MKENILGKIRCSEISSITVLDKTVHYADIDGKYYYFLMDLNNIFGISSAKSFNTRRSMMEKENKLINDRIIITGEKKSGNPKKVVISLDDFKDYCEYGKLHNCESIISKLLLHERNNHKINHDDENKRNACYKNDEIKLTDSQNKTLNDILTEFNAMKKEIEILRIEINNLMNIDQKANDDLNRSVKEAINAIYGAMEQSKEINEYVSLDYSNTYSISSIAKETEITSEDCLNYLIESGFIFKDNENIVMVDSYKKYGKTFMKYDKEKKKNIKYVRFTKEGKYLAEDIISGIIDC